MKKLILFLFLIIALLLGGAGWIYAKATEPVRAAEEKAIERAIKEADLDEAAKFTLFNGEETIYVVEGKNKKGESIIVWMPEKDGKTVVHKKGDGLTRQDAINKVFEEKNPEEVISIRPGMEEGIPFWEVYYSTGNGLINYYYVHFETGEMYKLIENL
ncbi:peptidase [Bacillus sp. FJAT-27225]|uniref:cell wall elongation regulator TseB-like domain-containing protein n=1 Tax=Bacillus sp. FJAT-27225 TaxID=1743144 RepID=UPI00080C2C83|nr:DUF5590 domain-containing protein [Bacillus sp. FJAT-27225]OCA90901.1 peptidase [Bacillus sp. FJAT-27225]